MPYFRNPHDAFAAAIDCGALSRNESADNYAGHFMYMHSDEPAGTDSFKHRHTRRYLHVSRLAPISVPCTWGGSRGNSCDLSPSDADPGL